MLVLCSTDYPTRYDYYSNVDRLTDVCLLLLYFKGNISTIQVFRPGSYSIVITATGLPLRRPKDYFTNSLSVRILLY
jgi:hypothetical protein